MIKFNRYKKEIDRELKKELLTLGDKTQLRSACEYAIFSGGKRVRPLLVLLIAEALNLKKNVMPSAIAVEFFHTASLIADDLPCMDNDDFRRNRPSLHKKFPESVAILASYTLIAAGYQMISKNAELLSSPDKLCILAIKEVSLNAGLKGATFGQFLDLNIKKGSYGAILEIIKKKTEALFEITFLLGWIFGGGDLQKIEQVKMAAHHFGLCFQIYDDLQDLDQDQKINNQKNIALLLGKPKAVKIFKDEIEQAKTSLKKAGLLSKEFQEIFSCFSS